jgi:DNA-directed RNA polymerase I subunit RPA43|uniref:DNA-directed RNA polymerase subunit n=1 Tax=Bionectria ochroleuca TaxID=29856 RepID=A0A8H7N3G3_BIOOC
MAPILSSQDASSTAKKEKKEKKDKSAKKRSREEDAADAERKHKKSKSIVSDPPPSDIANGEVSSEKKKKKKDKKKSEAQEDVANDESLAVKADEGASKPEKKKKKSKKDGVPEEPQTVAESDKKKKKKKDKKVKEGEQPVAVESTESKKKSKKHQEPIPESEEEEKQESAPEPEVDAMEVDEAPKPTSKSSSSKIHSPADIPSNPQFPFFNQTVSLYEPIYPNGWANPISGCESQHLRHLLNRYVPSLRGVLLEYSNVALNDKPSRQGAATDDDSHAVLSSRNEFGGGFGWITADVKLFVPSRGAWMEGSVNLQTEGHIGVVCFGKFNASIEARRLPPSWKWVPNEDAEDGFEETASVFTGADEHGVVRQIHSTGFWVDGNGDKVRGKTRFRIRNFDVGVSGDSTYLSLQGTMLDKSGEKKLVEQEAREARERKERKGGHARKRAPEFSMTRFLGEEQEEKEKENESQPAATTLGELKTFEE